MRILLAVGALQLLRSPDVVLFGNRFLLFDVGGIVAIAGLAATFIASAVSNTRTLYRLEPLPKSIPPSSTTAAAPVALTAGAARTRTTRRSLRRS